MGGLARPVSLLRGALPSRFRVFSCVFCYFALVCVGVVLWLCLECILPPAGLFLRSSVCSISLIFVTPLDLPSILVTAYVPFF